MLARHTRERAAFPSMFGVSAVEMIREMDASAADVANQRPRHETMLERVGVQRHDIPVRIVDPLDSSLTQQLSCSVRVSVSLAASRRGIHVSRMCNDLSVVAAKPVHASLLAFTTELAKQVAQTQDATACQVHARGVYSFTEAIDGWTTAKDKVSIESIPLIAETDVSGCGATSLHAGLEISHITACPCVQGALNTVLRLTGKAGLDVPLMTHSQRCMTTIMLRNLTRQFDLAAALRVIDGCMVRTQNTLPREQELAMVHRAHATASFIEDIVRDCSHAMRTAFAEHLGSHGTVEVASISQESIHAYDLHAETGSDDASRR